MHQGKEMARLFQYKKVSYKNGYKYFENKMGKKHPEVNIKGKNSIIIFWDSTNFDFMGSSTMKDMDSLAGVLGKYSYNYIFATEMREDISNYFLQRNGIENKNLNIAGDMDDFISSLYCDYPTQRKVYFSGDTSKNNKFYNFLHYQKIKPYYLIMDTSGKVLYHGDKYFLPSKDTTFMRYAKSGIVTKTLKNL